MDMGPKILITLVILAEAAYWVWLFLDAYHGHYPVTFLGWTSLVGDPIILIIIAIAFCSGRKYRGKDL